MLKGNCNYKKVLYLSIIYYILLSFIKEGKVVQWFEQLPYSKYGSWLEPDGWTGTFSVEFACSVNVCVAFLQLPPTVQRHVHCGWLNWTLYIARWCESVWLFLLESLHVDPAVC